MSQPPTRTRRHGGGSLAVGTLLVLLGTWFFLENLGFDLPGWDELWPLFPVLGGLAFLISLAASRGRDPGLAFPGTAGILVGLFFFCFTVGPLAWWEMELYWPAFPLIGGLAFLATWAAGRLREGGLLVPAAIGVATGVVGFSFTLGWFEWWVLPLVEHGWPLIPVVIGLWLIFRGVVSGRRPRVPALETVSEESKAET